MLVPTYKKTLGFLEPIVVAQIMIVWHWKTLFFINVPLNHPTNSLTTSGIRERFTKLPVVLIFDSRLLSNAGYGLFTFSAGNGWGMNHIYWLIHRWHVPSSLWHNSTSIWYGAVVSARLIAGCVFASCPLLPICSILFHVMFTFDGCWSGLMLGLLWAENHVLSLQQQLGEWKIFFTAPN